MLIEKTIEIEVQVPEITEQGVLNEICDSIKDAGMCDNVVCHNCVFMDVNYYKELIGVMNDDS